MDKMNSMSGDAEYTGRGNLNCMDHSVSGVVSTMYQPNIGNTTANVVMKTEANYSLQMTDIFTRITFVLDDEKWIRFKKEQMYRTTFVAPKG